MKQSYLTKLWDWQCKFSGAFITSKVFVKIGSKETTISGEISKKRNTINLIRYFKEKAHIVKSHCKLPENVPIFITYVKIMFESSFSLCRVRLFV